MPQLTGEAESALVGALGALLFRYTQQETIGLDLFFGDPAANSCRYAKLHCMVAADQPVSATVGQAAAEIAVLREAASEHDGNAGSNVALSFVSTGDCLDETDRHDVHFIVRAEPATLEVAYNSRLFKAATIDRLADALVRVFEATLDRPTTPICHLPVLSAGDLHTITVDWDSGCAEYPEEPVHRVFERLARERPEAVAVSFEGKSLTYGELDAQTSRLAHHLIACGVLPGSAVAVCVQPALDIVVAFLAIWKAGAVYVPLDPTHPEALIATILDEVQPAVVLTQSKLRPLTNPQRHAQFCFDTDALLTKSLPTSAPAVKVTPNDRAYVLYTSGTTGKPKGVDARHANLAHYIHVARQKYAFQRDDVFCSLARYIFSISLFELVLPLSCGAGVRLLARDDVLAPDRLAQTLSQVTVVHAGPSLLGNLFRYLRSNPSSRWTFPRMRHASSGGDLVPPTVIEEMKHVFENAELFVIYGCTEISCMGCTYPIGRDRKVTRTLVGKPFPDVAVRMTDPAGNIVPFGAVGEICFAGKGVVARAYLSTGAYRSRSSWREGRAFTRPGIWAGCIPMATSRFSVAATTRCSCAASESNARHREHGSRNRSGRTVRDGVKKLDEQEPARGIRGEARQNDHRGLSARLAAHLPDYMLPQALVVIEALPVTANGKLDRNALQGLPWEKARRTDPRARSLEPPSSVRSRRHLPKRWAWRTWGSTTISSTWAGIRCSR